MNLVKSIRSGNDRKISSFPCFLAFFVLCLLQLQCPTVLSERYSEKHRPQLHYSVPKNWMNDPNGLMYHNGTYHLFYQNNPFDKVPASIHWGHAVSKDLIHWTDKPVAIKPDKLGVIFSGCALPDVGNVTGLQTSTDQTVLVAIFTQHLDRNNTYALETQSLAFSNDNGDTWTMYPKNPIIQNPGFVDFRDPKVLHHNGVFYLTLAAGDRVVFYKSSNLLDWEKLSEFGLDHGSHAGTWECPDLFPLPLGDKELWVLLVSINPGGPNKGSATQYFVGNFNGTHFINQNSKDVQLWLDYGPDCYAGITFFGLEKYQRIFLCWMNNWLYGLEVPTDPWRGQMAIPRLLKLFQGNTTPLLQSIPKTGQRRTNGQMETQANVVIDGSSDVFLLKGTKHYLWDIELIFETDNLGPKDVFQFCMSNAKAEETCIGYDSKNRRFFMDRSKSGNVKFSSKYTTEAIAQRLVDNTTMSWRLIVDVSSFEFFSDAGLTCMTELHFPSEPFDSFLVRLGSNVAKKNSKLVLKSASFHKLQPVVGVQ